MTDITTEINDILEEKTNPYAPIKQNDFVYGEKEEIISTDDPSEGVAVRYLDRSTIDKRVISYLAKSISQDKAKKQLEAFIPVLDKRGFVLSGGCEVNLELLAAPAYVSKSKDNMFVFTLTFDVTVNGRG